FEHDNSDTASAIRRSQAVRAWMPWIILSVIVFVWGLPTVKSALNRPSLSMQVPALHLNVMRAPPVVPIMEKEKAVFTFNYLSATGTALLLAGVLSGLILRVPPLQLARLFAFSLHRVRTSLLTIAAMLALGYTTRYAGIDATMG